MKPWKQAIITVLSHRWPWVSRMRILTVAVLSLNIFCGLAFAEVLTSKEEALKQLLAQAETVTPKTVSLSEEQKKKIERNAGVELNSDEFRFYIGEAAGKIVGYAAEDTVPGKWGPIHYILGITPEGRVTNVIILEYKERRGRPVAKKRFLKQYIDKTASDPVRLRKDIDGVTGATISSRGITDGVRKLLYIFEEFFKS